MRTVSVRSRDGRAGGDLELEVGGRGQPSVVEVEPDVGARNRDEVRTLARLGGGDGPGLEAGKFVAPHGLAVDSRGDIYVGEVSYTEFPRLFPERQIPWRMRSLQKLKKLS